MHTYTYAIQTPTNLQDIKFTLVFPHPPPVNPNPNILLKQPLFLLCQALFCPLQIFINRIMFFRVKLLTFSEMCLTFLEDAKYISDVLYFITVYCIYNIQYSIEFVYQVYLQNIPRNGHLDCFLF